MKKEQQTSRREMMMGSLRYGALAGLAALGTVLYRKHRDLGAECVNQGVCGRCPVLGGCGLPLAIDFRSQEHSTSDPEALGQI
jgi:hypothetical protein